MSSKCSTTELYHPPPTASFLAVRYRVHLMSFAQQGDVSQALLGQENSTAGLGESCKIEKSLELKADTYLRVGSLYGSRRYTSD